MKKILSILLFTLLSFSIITVPYEAYAVESAFAYKDSCSKKAENLREQGRRFWIEHVFWTRDFIKSDLSNLEDKSDVLNRLLKNQEDIGGLIKPYYGAENSKKLTELLKKHISLAVQVLDAAKSGNKEDLDKYNKLWHKNADDIAKFLSDLNPEWSEKELKDMLYKHLDFITTQVTNRLNGNWAGDIEAFDKGEEHMIKFADVISNGIIKQFPNKF